mgnify:CR=1 FL=1
MMILFQWTMDTFYHIPLKFTRGKLFRTLPVQAESGRFLRCARASETKGGNPAAARSPLLCPAPAEKQDKAEVSCYQKKGAPTL